MRIHVLAAAALLSVSFGLHAATDDPFVVHEWGTFTTVQGADSEQIWWCPTASGDLPGFVHRAAVGADDRPVIFSPKDLTALVRMETPVIYFYSQRERVADVRILFHGGNLTEWYPQATRVEARSMRGTTAEAYLRQFRIEWNGVTILPRGTREMTLDRLIREKASGEADHYYLARETDANFLRVASARGHKGAEYERDLFYRGLGYFQAPLAVGMDADELQLSLNARGAEHIRGAFLVSIRQGMMRYQKIDRPISNALTVIDPNTQPFGALGDVSKLAMNDMARELVAQGLYEKEARAMVSTWQDQWFAEEGTRVLYLLPQAWTDRTLQLQVSPKPDSVVRVMVGRAELITPSTERQLREQILTFRTGDAKTKLQVIENVREMNLGRFLNPATTKITRDESDEVQVRAAWELASAASQPHARADGRSARN
jgi:hypothetical protein